MNEKEPFFSPTESDPSRSYEEKQESLLKKLNRAARPMMLAVVLGMSAFGAPAGVEAAPELHTVEVVKAREELIDTLKEAMGKEPVLSILMLESVKSSEERDNLLEKGRPFVSEAIEKIGVTHEELVLFMQELPPALSYHIQKVSFKEFVPVPEKYGVDPKKNAVGGMLENDHDVSITQYGLSRGFESLITRTLLHEFAHSGDWSRNTLLTTDERIILCSRILGRVLASDRYQSSYVESISNKDSQKAVSLKVNEYWAVIAAAACSSEAKTMNPKDLKIVEDVFKKISPSISMDEVRDRVAAFVAKRENKNSLVEKPKVEERIEVQKENDAVKEVTEDELQSNPQQLANDEDQPLERPDLPNDD